MTLEVKLTVNGVERSAQVEARTLLAELLRDHLKLTGTHVGCDTTQCGCCVVHLDGKAIKSCTILAVQARGKAVTTIEGLAQPDGTLHPMQEAFREHHGLQCGFCTPGMVMMGVDIARRNPGADEDLIRHQLEGNICRCTGYQGIVEAILSVATPGAVKGHH
ncbi:2Fe-2S iron-sulfur cluster-binding protein [Methylocella sp. CPCC 101449]|uniref:(2Fe-2S)-binding protein n=1 Tax=Methylocella sp. CPCC 101449 TaxID=2987531 RepID=UPI00288C6935|nr:2Fe-2S iron-sulfur cluster-binding protein [Methylocella sp. CPCC 101449]MDT2019845.1 (2Fe-2S)-binding protein [Methylocella sp. CPCC 101449]